MLSPPLGTRERGDGSKNDHKVEHVPPIVKVGPGACHETVCDDLQQHLNDLLAAHARHFHSRRLDAAAVARAEVIEAGMDGKNAMVTVKFVSEQVNVTRDSEDRIIDGDPNQVTEITDIWAFSRDTTLRDPNWKLVETRSQN